MESQLEIVKMEVYHRDFNLTKRENLNELPEAEAVFAIFGIVDNEPINCRYVGPAKNLRQDLRALFEQTEDDGLRKFMQGPWVQMIQYSLMPDKSTDVIQREVQSWIEKFQPKIDETGNYPGYYE